MADEAATVPGLGEAPVDNAGVGAELGIACPTAEAKLLGLTDRLHAHSATTPAHVEATQRRRFDPFPGIAAVTG